MTNDTISSRDNGISIAKGFGIILMVIGHSQFPYILDFIYMFHMPLFFFISGWCFKDKYLTDFRMFSIRRLKSTYIPFLKWGLFFLLLHNVFFHLNIYNDEYGYAGHVSHLYGLSEFIRHAFIGCGLFLYPEELLGGYWFLVQLFWASILGFFVIKFIKNPFIGATLLLFLSFVVKLYVDYTIPYTGIGSITLLSSSFFVYGYAIRNYNIKFNRFAIFGCFILVGIGSFIWSTTMQAYTFLNILPYAITGVLGSIMVLQISIWYDKRKTTSHLKDFLVFAGENSLIILTWHFLSFKLVSFLIICIEGYRIEMLAMFPVIENIPMHYAVLYVIVGVMLPLSILKLVRKTIPWLQTQISLPKR